MGGRTIPIRWHDRPASAWVPDPLIGMPLDLPDRVRRRAARAQDALRRCDRALAAGRDPLARLLLRAEGVASSNIEGLRVPVEEVAAAEIDPTVGGDAGWMADNLAAVQSALDSAGDPLTVASLHGWHQRLMRSSPLPPGMVGAFRGAQGWIGGTSPLDAVFVPPPPDLVAALMDDLVTFANADVTSAGTGGGLVDPVTLAAVLHGQFETIHPYGDGNGRLGRVIVGWVLRRHVVDGVPPPVSVLIARDPGGYLSGLHRFRTGALAPWVGWFADVVHRSADATATIAERAEALRADWVGRLDRRSPPLRADAAARRALDVVAASPVMNAAVLAARLGVSERSARTALHTLESCGIVAPLEVAPARSGRPRRWWVAADATDLLRSWMG